MDRRFMTTQTAPVLTAAQAFHQAGAGRRVIGWKLDRAERDALLARMPARYPSVVADHVTLKAHVDGKSALPPPSTGVIVGRSDDGRGVEAMVVQVDGSTDRPDGGTYHITWSLGAGRRAVQSNDVIKAHGWQALEPPVPVQLVPALF
jgi:hypothetical protein